MDSEVDGRSRYRRRRRLRIRLRRCRRRRCRAILSDILNDLWTDL